MFPDMSRQLINQFVQMRAKKFVNETTGTTILADANEDHILTLRKTDRDLVNPGDVIKVNFGHLLVIERGNQREMGLTAFPVSEVMMFAQQYRFSETDKDSFGRSANAPVLINESVPLCQYRGAFYAPRRFDIRQGDKLVAGKDTYRVQENSFFNAFIDSIQMIEQIVTP